MLQSLDYSVEFPTTGRSFQNRIEFAPGLTAITGRNEAGKTLIVEMIGYALFGKDALRGLASDYSRLTVTLHLTVAGSEWVLTRAKKETFTVDDEVVAVGASAINAEVPKRLGFNLDVFNIACASQQGDLGRLTDMRPTERRAMIDRLIGIDLLEEIEKQCKAEAKTQETVALSLVAGMSVPEEPVKPDGYKPSDELEEELRICTAHEDERQRLLRIEKPEEPVPPVAPDETDVEALESHESARQEALREKAHLEGQLAGMPLPTCTREELEKALAYRDYTIELAKRGPRPEHAAGHLINWSQIWEQKQWLQLGTTTCPKCEHEFVPQHDELDIEAIRALPDPPISKPEVNQQMRRCELWLDAPEPVEEFELSNLNQEILAHAHADDRRAVSDALASLDLPVDRSGDLRAARAYQRDLAVYAERAARYDSELRDFENARRQLDALADRSGELVELQRRLADSRHYGGLARRYRDAKAQYDAVCGRASEARELAGGYTRGASALRSARVRVKRELAPSLSTAASKLLAAMTAGERRHIDVDADFNIMVDGQPLQTLSGSGKSVVNLALRIGLGQVLTARVLPLFIGDEVDADCDKDRANAVAETFNNLRDYLTQIILVTHKQVDADHHIRLGELVDEN